MDCIACGSCSYVCPSSIPLVQYFNYAKGEAKDVALDVDLAKLGMASEQAYARRLWAERFGIRVFEGYGATETSPVLSANTPMDYRPGSVGRLLPGIEYALQARAIAFRSPLFAARRRRQKRRHDRQSKF